MHKVWIDRSGVSAAGGRATMMIDGVPTVPLWYALSDIPAARTWNECSQRGIRNFGACGVRVVCLDVDLHSMWGEDGCVDTAPFLRHVEAALGANPDAFLIARLHVNPPYHWLRSHPDELMRYYSVNGEGQSVPEPLTDAGTYGDRTIARHLPCELRASVASEVFLHDCAEVLRTLCRALTADERFDRLVGLQVAYGHCGEWHMWGSFDGSCEPDYSEPMQRQFRRVLRERYGDEATLRRYYGEGASFETERLALPHERSRYNRATEQLLSPTADARVIDSMRTLSVAMAEAIGYLCGAVKDEVGDRMLVGTFYTYFFIVGAAYSSHFEPMRVLEHPSVDFVAAPSAYTENKQAGRMNMLRYVAESCRLHGKLFLCEMDQGYVSWDLETHSPRASESEEEYAALMKRNLLENILLGHGAWYYDHRLPSVSIYKKEEYWSTPERLATVAAIQRVCERLLHRPYEKTTDVLLVVDTETRYHTSADPCPFSLFDAIGRSGVGLDRLYLHDLPSVELSRYRAIVFLDCRVMTRQMYGFICKNVLSGDKTAVTVGGFAEIVDREVQSGGLPDGLRTVPPEAQTSSSAWRELFRAAGAHVYTEEGEAVIADGDLLLVHAKGIPTTAVHLPAGEVLLTGEGARTHLIDVRTGEVLL